ncbi:Methyltransferase domain-containing protein [Natronincola peptidivorans]|uniref:Methyltransferase domain-containing protein n=1 Tax=Natronincola peptidivorans TaxID=426128 RepID=A0A1I0CQ17_9FIRM|nr:class I SAM-dependent methyltransferase [Natronincola peptidivorans]SET21831.1 Methyltransferase domain-containing protein [Natronincola peptidivorans]
MIQKIGNVILNLKHYSGKDHYSDGDIENELLDIVKNHSDFTEILKNDIRWPVYYHLTPIRRNLLEWYNFDNSKSLLEIGAGCGALTGLFCEKCADVTAVELSKRRAEIIAYRNKEKSNLDIVVGNLNEIELQKKYDYITLIGVLEYAALYTKTPSPYEDFLKNIKSMLKKDGELIIGIENKFGLKYWSGSPEDHTGRLFDGLEGYLTEDSGVRTFSKQELEELLKSIGFNILQFYYPMPDYKIPVQIFSESFLPTIGQIDSFIPSYSQERLQLFNEKLVYDNIIKNGLFDFFANSFLILCKYNGDEKNANSIR